MWRKIYHQESKLSVDVGLVFLSKLAFQWAPIKAVTFYLTIASNVIKCELKMGRVIGEEENVYPRSDIKHSIQGTRTSGQPTVALSKSIFS